MIEQSIFLKAIDPLMLYGANNQLLQVLQSFFSKLKIIARGDELKAIGPENEITRFVAVIEQVFLHIERHNSLTAADLEELLFENNQQGNGKTHGDSEILIFGQNGKSIRARNHHQKEMVKKFKTHDLLIATGPAGSGKTYMAVALAIKALRNHEVKRIILSRPAVESGEQLGFLPGDLKEKLDPYLQPLYDALLDMMPARKLNDLMDKNIIQIAPLAFMRGRTLEKCFVILDEAQNATIGQLKMFLTRMGEHAKFIITGDVTQVDLPKQVPSGLLHAKDLLSKIEGIAMIEFDQKDIIRHKLVQKIVQAYETNNEGPKPNN
ncbi:MAG: PhoH family protein [Bacteroidales bacterium]|nr:PhoH family protein [Bacteroidales bacterium]